MRPKPIITIILSVWITLSMAASVNPTHSADSPVTVDIVATTDVHGNFFPYNFIEQRYWGGSMARVATYTDSLRRSRGRGNVVLLDNGDILQGQPPAYYYNFIDTTSGHIAADVYHYLGVDAATIGNHDVETGHDVYDRWIAQCGDSTPVLGANVIDVSTGKPYLKPYTIIERGGMRIAVIGLLTPAIPSWLPEVLWEGLRFDDLTESARYWADYVRATEHPDAVIGLFHTGAASEPSPSGTLENAALKVGREVAGYDLIIFGHDHRRHNSTLTGPDGRRVVMLNPSNNARAVAHAILKRDAATGALEIEGEIVEIDYLTPSPDYMRHFGRRMDAVRKFVADTVGTSDGRFAASEAFFGPSAFMDLIHRLQIEITGADISMAAPLSADGVIEQGPLTIADMFTLYKYENMLYVMELTGAEIKNYLERSYDGWVTTMHSPSDHMLLLTPSGPGGTVTFANPFYNFDSAYGIDYTVDLTAKAGNRINIASLSDGRPFDPGATYRVAVNSYRGNGGGDLLTLGAGISPDRLSERVVSATDRDLRFYLMEAIRRAGHIAPTVTPNWRFIPDDYAAEASERDRKLLRLNN